MKKGAAMNEKLIKIGEESWELFIFTKKFFVELFKPPFEFSETIKQSFSIGYKSLGLVSITGSIIGLTLALQLIPTLAKFGAESLIPSMLSIAILREIGPVIISLICAGKMGSAIGAELGSMKVTEQISAMEVSAVNPFKYLVVTRVIATTLTVPILVIYSNALSLLGGYFALSITSNIGIQLYFDSAISILGFSDIIPSTLKTAFFGFSIGIVGCFKGYNCARGTESVGLAANSSVVLASLLVIILDLIAVQISSLLF